MRLRTRFLLVLGVFVLVLTGLVSILAQRFFLWRAQDLEAALVRDSVARCSKFLTWRATEFNRLAASWPLSDGPDAFAGGGHPDDLTAPVVDRRLAEFRLSFMAVVSATGDVLVARAWNLLGNEPAPLPEGLLRHLHRSSPLMSPAGPDSTLGGLLVVDGEIWTVAVRPAAPGIDGHPSRGTLVLARRWGVDDEQALAFCGGDTYTLRAALPETGVPAGNDRAIASATTDFFTVRAQGQIRDVFGQPTLTLAVEANRWFFTSGLASMLYLSVWILLCGVAVGGFVFVLVDRWVLRALQRSIDALRKGVREVATQGDPGGRLAEGSGDEIQELRRGVNEMLSALESTQRAAVDRQKALIQSQKLAALGTLVAGVAHEVNNPNSVITLNASLLLRTLDRNVSGVASSGGAGDSATGEVRTLVAEMKDASERITGIVRALKGFSRPATDRMVSGLSVNDIIQDACAMLRHRIAAANATLDLQLAEVLPTVRGEAQQLTQVMVNLIQNACEATCRPGSRITVTTAHDPLTRQVWVSVADEGRGLTPEATVRLFEPFFTTRRDEGGTGLGLPISMAIVESHGGRLDVGTRAEGGACFTMRLPAEDVPS